MDKAQIEICKHLARAYRHVVKAQEVINRNKWDDFAIFEVLEPLSKALAEWVADDANAELEIKGVEG